MTHTAGPWTRSVDYIGTAAGTICTMYRPCDRSGRGLTADEQEANARLIAAAPDLLAACEGLAAWDQGDQSDSDRLISEACSMARAAIRRAKS